MSVRIIQKSLQTLVELWRAGGASSETIQDLEAAVDALAPFADKSVGSFAGFLSRAHQFEQDGHWPEEAPPIQGLIVDDPDITTYAERLKDFFENHAFVDGVLTERVPEEMNLLQTRLKGNPLKELAQAIGLTKVPRTKIIEAIFEHLTGKKYPDAILELHARTLEKLAGTPEFDSRLQQIEQELNKTQIRSLAKALGINSKDSGDAIRLIRGQFQSETSEQVQSPPENTMKVPEQIQTEPETTLESNEKLDRLVETLQELRRKAQPENAPYEEIEDELQRVESQLDHEEAVEIAKRLGAVGSIHSRKEALEKIRWKVLEYKRARENVLF